MGINQLIECGESLVMACEDLLHPVKSASDYDIITSENSSSLNLINFDESLHLCKGQVPIEKHVPDKCFPNPNSFFSCENTSEKEKVNP